MSTVIHFFRVPGELKRSTERKICLALPTISKIETEFCYNVELVDGCLSLTSAERDALLWLITETFEPANVAEESFLRSISDDSTIIEVGPRLAFSSAWSSNCASMLSACGITSVGRVERSRRYRLTLAGGAQQATLSASESNIFLSLVHDRMTECIYPEPLSSFASGVMPEPVRVVPVLAEGSAALKRINAEKGLGFDDWDIDFYTNMFVNQLQRDPTDVECFDLGQSNSEHSRHWFFGGKMVIDGKEKPQTLFQMVKSTLPVESNSIIAFHDNSSAIRGYPVKTLIPADPSTASPMQEREITLHPILTAETHNFPSGVAPFPGAETGTGGRLRDVQATGQGAHTLAGISAYCVGNLNIPGNPMPWELEWAAEERRQGRCENEGTYDGGIPYAENLALPLDIEVEASNGASDYGNKYGEPVVAGYTRSFGQRLANGERVEWIKPIMFTAGVGMLDSRHAAKADPEEGMVICKIGGPAYRIGMGGGAASSRGLQPSADDTSTDGGRTGTAGAGSASDLAALDFDAVQRGDAEMENRMNRVIRACVEMGADNPIVSIHDQGAGGNGNVLKEIVDPLGARLELRAIPTGDPTLSVMEIWGAEYQENNAFLVRPENLQKVLKLGDRENCPVSPVGVVTTSGRVVAVDSRAAPEEEGGISTPFDLPLSLVLGKMPQKTFTFTTPPITLKPLSFPSDTTVSSALRRVLRLLDVGSKRFLTNKVDRSVTGLVAQQQCVGPLQTPLSDVAVVAQSHFSRTGVAVAVGEQPIKGLISSAAQARLTVAEALTNLVFAKVTALEDVKASGNWMWAAKLEGEGAKMYAACEALVEALQKIGPGVDGGKDSLSMAAKVAGGEVVKSPGELTLTCYAACPDITKTVTPDLKLPGSGQIILVDLAPDSMRRLGGSALARVYNQIGDESPDFTDFELFKKFFTCMQTCIDARFLSAGHDVSDGGVVVALLEMAFAGNCGFEVTLPSATIGKGAHFSEDGDGGAHTNQADTLASLHALFAEEVCVLLEVAPQNTKEVLSIFRSVGVPALHIGSASEGDRVVVSAEPTTAGVPLETVFSTARSSSAVLILDESMAELRDVWESTSFALEMLQSNPACVKQEQEGLRERKGIPYKVTFPTPIQARAGTAAVHKVAVIRQEGSNGDREMLSAFSSAGFEVWDVNMRDLLAGRVTLDAFRGIAFCGGFSYADVNDSAKGWAGVIKFNPQLLAQFSAFRDRPDTFSLGVCNGCQLMALLGWVPFPTSSSSTTGGSTAAAVAGGANAAASVVTGEGESEYDATKQTRFVHNTSGRYESRWVGVKVLPSPAVLLRDMVDSTLGVWVAHGEGRAYFPDATHLQRVHAQQLAPLRYVDDSNEVTETYPLNPNGSPEGIAALCSPDGRHLAMMPHPERCFLSWQCPHGPNQLSTPVSTLTTGAAESNEPAGSLAAPWLKLFTNAMVFCEGK